MASTADLPTASADSPESFILHVLCPSLPPPNRYTIQDVDPSSTVAALKDRVTHAIPSQPSPQSQRLIYRGRPLTNDAAVLKDVLEPPNATEYYIHLVLPPSSEPPASCFVDSPASQSAQPTSEMFPRTTTTVPHRSSHPPDDPWESFSAADTVRASAEVAEIGLALRRNIDSLRRELETRDRGRSSGGTTGFSSSLDPGLLNAQQRPSRPDQSSSGPSSHPGVSRTISSETPAALNGLPVADLLAHATMTEETRLSLQILTRQVELAEAQLNSGIAPPMDHIIRMRSHLFAILDDQCLNPLAERDGSVAGLLARVLNIYMRADQLHQSEALLLQSQTAAGGAISAASASGPAAYYMLNSPSGYQGLLVSPQGTDVLQATLSSLRAMRSPDRTPNPGGNPAPVPNLRPNANAAVMENVVRQAVLNQRGLDNHADPNGQLGFARIMRRLWQFVRLYFFCYMFTEPGTWARVLFVTLAVLFVLSSETGVDQRLYQLFVAPVQRHLEGLVHLTPTEPPAPAQGQSGQRGPGPATGNPRAGLAGEMRFQLRRVERSVALFLASLVPGVGERQVAVRNAAEAAQRAREEEERRQREEAQQQQQQQQQQQENNGDAAESGPHSTIPREAEN
ncbi:uncharacterized protein BP01DRAFT_382338 [Aspergillus saccharolyticus JOP 1030-1]|uniref:Ubiquitin-like domain-containing protein n=1 Tax=Aspergillus saccharolyticus JOP 1030-1 TaxID=1450539 RepID=A0A319A091_9EURO|nr:hypothetical protein BP01DRAFT_382338 [Aspergillus saccharolyticus JOP 1030-1]PYH45718.1 hypothetical protein BP01DRAFT_382338 [Aspergillus saccharolyticus JOP 1030-1]